MSIIGHTVHEGIATEAHPRIGEGGFALLKNGDILFAYTRFEAGGRDESRASIAALTSADGGEHFSGERILISPDENAANVMSASLLRMGNGDLGLFYLYKDKRDGSCRLLLARSSDEGQTFSAPVPAIPDPGYFVVNNDRVSRLPGGRILIPTTEHGIAKDFVSYHKGDLYFYASDDDGRSFYRLAGPFALPCQDKSLIGAEEAGLRVCGDGTLHAWVRTDLYCQYECFSSDGGETWTPLSPAPVFSSPRSPMQMKSACGLLAAVRNPIPNYEGRLPGEPRHTCYGRYPLVLSVSEDDGKTFPRTYTLEEDPKDDYCYPAILDLGDALLVAYYRGRLGEGLWKDSLRIKKVKKEELLG